MALTDIPLDEIHEERLQGLIAAQAAESLYIDYKSETYGGNDDQRREFLADVSSFANASGGDLVIGMTAGCGIPTGFKPFIGDTDSARLRLENMARDGLQPRITGLATRAIGLANGGAAIVIRVPKSSLPPHRVIFKNSNRFWVRSSAGKFEPNVEELRQIFMAGPQRLERIRAFHMERVREIEADRTPVPILDADRPLLVVHVMPYSVFDIGHSVPPAQISEQGRDFPPIASLSPEHWLANFDGFLALSNADARADQRAYVQVFRSGAVESVAALGTGILETMKIETFVVRYSGWYAHTLHKSGMSPPFVVLVSILNASQASFTTAPHRDATPVASTRGNYHFAEAILPIAPQGNVQTAPHLRSILDRLAGLAGKSHTSTFDSDGNYILQMRPPGY